MWYEFTDMDESLVWKGCVMALKELSSTIGDTTARDSPEWFDGFREWIRRYDEFVVRWGEQRVPPDVLFARNDIVEGVASHGS